jgi:hypothetical protein
MDWITANETLVLANFPTDLKPAYDQWIIDNPGKAGRLAEIIAATRAEFRDALAVNPANVLDPDEEKIPQSCTRALQALVVFQIETEMGHSVSEERQQAMTRADLFLRQIAYQHFSARPEGATHEPTPAYTPPPWKEANQERSLP